MKKLSTRYFAHRGLHNSHTAAPENSLEAFRRAVNSGYGIELDVQRTSDGHIVVFHDDTLTRVCGADKKPIDMTLDEIRQYRIYNSDQRIPLLSEVLELVDGKVPLLIEFKPKRIDNLLCENAMKLLDNYEGEYCIESFNPFTLWWFKRNRPAVLRGQLVTDFIQYNDMVPMFLLVLLQTLAYNYFTRPDFISLDMHCKNWASYRLMTKNLTQFGWTFRSAAEIKAYEDKYDYFIFEQRFSS